MALKFVDKVTRKICRDRSGLLQIVLGLNAGLRGIGLGFCLFAPCLLGGSAQAAPPSQFWVSNGPYGGYIGILDFPSTSIAIAVDPTTPTTVYAASGLAGIFKSTNGGGTWAAINNGLVASGSFSTGSIVTLAVDPTTPTTLYAGTSSGLLRSTDGGVNWNPLPLVLSGLSAVDAVVIDPTTPTTIYVATTGWGPVGGGVFKTTNGGTDWSAVGSGLPAAPQSGLAGVTGLVINPLSPTTLYAVAGAYLSGTDVYKSIDGGTSWASASTGQSGTYVYSLAIDPTTPATLYATLAPVTGGALGVFKTTDGGGSWSSVNSGLSGAVWSVALDPASPSTLYAGTGGVFKSTDGGGNWTAVATPNGQFVSTFAFAPNPGGPSTIYAGGQDNGGGIFKSTDGGASWSAMNAGLSATSVSDLAIDPTTPTTIYAGTNDGSGGVFKSTDGGGSWIAAGTGLSPSTSMPFGATSLAVDPHTPTTLYATGNYVGGGGGGVYKSTDGANSWVGVSSGVSYALAINPATPTTIYLGTYNGVFKSTDGTASWTAANTGLTINGVAPLVSALAINPATPTTIYAMAFVPGSWSVSLFETINGGEAGQPSTPAGMALFPPQICWP